jgi:hypothetical protein
MSNPHICEYHEKLQMNPFEKACREWLKGCSVSRMSLYYAAVGKLTPEPESPRECPECTTAFLDHIEKLGREHPSE